MALMARKDRPWDPFAELREISDRLNRSFAGTPFFAAGEQTLAGTYKGGSLTVRIPKSPAKEPKAKQIEVG